MSETSLAETEVRLESLDDGFNTYRCIYADPPWSYRDSTCRGAARKHYSTMSLDELCRLPVWGLSHHAGCHLWLWCTWPKIRDGWHEKVMQAWAFEWQGQITWDKERMGLGRYLRNQTEALLFGVRKKMPLLARDQPDIVRAKRATRHSEKPDVFRKIVERISPGPRIELFARQAADGWDRWGLEAPDVAEAG